MQNNLLRRNAIKLMERS